MIRDKTVHLLASSQELIHKIALRDIHGHLPAFVEIQRVNPKPHRSPFSHRYV